MIDTLREAPFGQLVRLVTGNRFFKYPEELDSFQCPACYRGGDTAAYSNEKRQSEAMTDSSFAKEEIPTQSPVTQTEPVEAVDLEKIETGSTSGYSDSARVNRTATLALERTQTFALTAERFAAEQAVAAERTKSRPILATRTADNTILVDW